jgi:hypothetical protein
MFRIYDDVRSERKNILEKVHEKVRHKKLFFMGIVFFGE